MCEMCNMRSVNLSQYTFVFLQNEHKRENIIHGAGKEMNLHVSLLRLKDLYVITCGPKSLFS